MPNSSETAGTVPPGAVGRVLVRRRRIAARLDELAAEIAAAYPSGELTMLVVLDGAMVFASELVRRLALRLRLESAWVRSYPCGSRRSAGPKLRMPLDGDFAGRDVLIVDDILDSGRTLRALREAVAARGAASVRTCVLFRKRRGDLPGRREADFHGLDVPDVFVVGFGLDCDGLWRDLPDLHELARGGGEGR